MYANGFEKINFSIESGIISFAKSFCGKYLAMLFSNSLQIYSLINHNFSKLGEYTRDETSIREKNPNHWIQWISQETIVIGTQTGHLIFININNDNNTNSSIIENAISIDIVDNIITSHSSIFGALVISTPGPFLHFISPSGEILSSVSFTTSSSQIPKIIRQIDINDPYSIFVFSDGTVAHTKLKEQEIIEKADILIDFFPMINDISTAYFSNSKSFIVFQTFKGTLIRMFTQTHEITFICEESSLFHITHDSTHIISLSAIGTLNIWSNKTDHSTETKIKFGSHDNLSADQHSLNFISSEIDLYGYRLFCSTSNSKEAYIISFALTNMSKPSLMFCTSTHVIIPPTKVTIYAPTDMLKDGYPLKYVSYLPDKKNIAVAGRKYFSLYSNDTGSWKMVKDENSVCRALWINESHSFISVVFNCKESCYLIFLLSSEFFTIIDTVKLEGNFIDYDNCGNYFVIGTNSSVSIYRVMNVNNGVTKIVKFHEFNTLYSFEKVCLIHDYKSVAILTTDKQLIELPSNEVLIEGVTSVTSCKEDDLLFVAAHGQQFVFYYSEKVLIRLENKIPATIVDALSLYKMPNCYEFGKFEFDVDEFLPQVIFHFIDKPDVMLNIVKSFSSTSGISINVSHAMNLAFKAGKFEKFYEMLNKLGEVKVTFLLIALFNVDTEFVGKIKELLPSCDELIQKYPDVAEQIRGIYSTK